MNLESARSVMADAIATKHKGCITVTGVHGVTEAQDDPEFHRILNASFLCTPDGMPMVWMGKLAGHKQMDRIYGPDLMELICETGVAPGWKHFFYGGAPGVVEELNTKLQTRFLGMQMVGTFTLLFRPLNVAEERELAEMVAQAKPDLFWVGLSTPKQEHFMATYLPRLDTTLMIGVGAAFDFHAGKVKQAPRGIERSGLGWAYRVWQGRDPAGFGNVTPTITCSSSRVFLQKSGLRKYSLD